MLYGTFQGTPFERGFQHGQQFKAEIKATVAAYVPKHWSRSAEVRRLQGRLLQSLADQYPELLVEMTGISQGSGLRFEQILLLNLVLATNDLESDAIASTFKLACTALGFTDSDQGPVIGKNCDETQKAAAYYLFATVRPHQGLAYLCITWVGTVWAEAGLNEAGLAIVQTAGPSVRDQDGTGIVCNIVPRPILAHCTTTQAAVECLAQMRVAGWGMGAVVADASGHLVAVEKSYDSHAVQAPVADAVFCVNHFVDPGMTDVVPIAHPGITTNSQARYQTLQSLLGRGTVPHTVAGLIGVLGYRGTAGFVCQHGENSLYSNYSFVAAPKTRTVWLSESLPCQQQFTAYTL